MRSLAGLLLAAVVLGSAACVGETDGSSSENLVVFEAAACRTAPNASGTRYLNVAIPAQRGRFTAEWDVTPAASVIDGAVALSPAVATAWRDHAVTVRFAPEGVIDVRNGAAYGAAAVVRYAGGVRYHVRAVVDVPARRFSAWVAPAGGAEVQIAANAAFRETQAAATQLTQGVTNVALGDSVGSLTSCGFRISRDDAGPPTVALTAPSAGATLTGTATLAATASDDDRVAGVQFLVDGSPAGAEDTTAPYSVALDTTALANGAHTLAARARDASGAATTSAAVAVTVSNTTTMPPPGGAGTVALTLATDRSGTHTNVVVSAGVPFAPGVLRAADQVLVRNAAGAEVPAQATVLATWPGDGSIRSVLLAFRATLSAGATAQYTVAYGAARTQTATGLAPNPDGPVVATLPAAWYGASRVSGYLSPAAANRRFPAFDAEMERRAAAGGMSPAWESYAVSCGGTSTHRTYYDGPHGLYTRFLRHGDLARYRRARAEAVWYRANELAWNAGRTMAWHTCQGAGWTPTRPLEWHVLRRMLGQGMLDDYLVTGDPAAREAVVGMGEAYRQNLPALTSGSVSVVETTERNMAWPMMGLAAYYAVDPRPVVRDALRGLVDRTIAWQNRGASGAFEHDIVRPDPSECGDGPRGASPFMTSLLVDGLMDYHALTGDARVADVVRRVAVWYERDAVTPGGASFEYLWNCRDTDYSSDDYADLNLLINHVFGAAYVLTRDAHWLDFGDTMGDHGVDAIYVGRPKQWNQAARGFYRYMGYRAVGRTP